MYELYIDDSILVGPDPTEIYDILKLMCKTRSDIIEEGALEDFLGVNIDIKPNSTIPHTTTPT